MVKNQKSYIPEFKQQIVDLYLVGGTSYSKLEREYGVNQSTISRWVKQLSPIKVSEDETVSRSGSLSGLLIVNVPQFIKIKPFCVSISLFSSAFFVIVIICCSPSQPTLQ